MKKETLEELAAFCKSPGYSELVKKLIVQGLIKIEETIVEIHARAEDHAIVKKVVSRPTDFYALPYLLLFGIANAQHSFYSFLI